MKKEAISSRGALIDQISPYDVTGGVRLWDEEKLWTEESQTSQIQATGKHGLSIKLLSNGSRIVCDYVSGYRG